MILDDNNSDTNGSTITSTTASRLTNETRFEVCRIRYWMGIFGRFKQTPNNQRITCLRCVSVLVMMPLQPGLTDHDIKSVIHVSEPCARVLSGPILHTLFLAPALKEDSIKHVFMRRPRSAHFFWVQHTSLFS